MKNFLHMAIGIVTELESVMTNVLLTASIVAGLIAIVFAMVAIWICCY